MEGEEKRDLKRKGLLIMTDQSGICLHCRLPERGKQGLELVGSLQFKGDSEGCASEAFPITVGWFTNKARPGIYTV